METKTLAVAFTALLIAFAGLAFAFPGFGDGGWQGMMQGWQGNPGPRPFGNGTGNFTGGPGMPPCGNGSEFPPHRFDGNGSANFTGWQPPMHPSGNSTLNRTQLREEQQKFESAVLSGDWATAESLHSTYGFGGALFGKLNETTFATYSQLYKLADELRQQLGPDAAIPSFGEEPMPRRGAAGHLRAQTSAGSPPQAGSNSR